jgi:hypothetical protein
MMLCKFFSQRLSALAYYFVRILRFPLAWQAGGDDTQLKETIAKCVESSLVEILSLVGEA